MFTLEQKQNIKTLYLEGKSSREIAKIFNCSKFPILKILKDIPKRNASEYKQHPCNKQFGQNNPNWKGGAKSIYNRIRALSIYWKWHHFILNRDNYTCQNCTSKQNLEVHHIKTLKTLVKEYCKNKNILPINFTEQDLLSQHFYETDNGITFCKKCHKDWHNKNGR